MPMCGATASSTAGSFISVVAICGKLAIVLFLCARYTVPCVPMLYSKQYERYQPGIYVPVHMVYFYSIWHVQYIPSITLKY